MGWRFTAADDKSLRPSAFWGLTRKTLKSITKKKIKKQSSQTERNNQPVIVDSNEGEILES